MGQSETLTFIFLGSVLAIFHNELTLGREIFYEPQAGKRDLVHTIVMASWQCKAISPKWFSPPVQGSLTIAFHCHVPLSNLNKKIVKT